MTAVKQTSIQNNRSVGKRLVTPGAILLAATLSIGAGISQAQVAGSSTIGVTQEEMKVVMRG
jgi:hypothetical protein